MTRNARRTGGFTLIELLVVVAIIMILLSMTLSVTSSVRESARKAVCAGRQKQMAMAVFAYGNDNRGYLPNAGPWNNPARGNWSTTNVAFVAMTNYLESGVNDPTWRKRFFICPSSRPFQQGNSTQISYSFYGGTPSDHNLTLLRVLASARKNAPELPNGQFALFSDNTFLYSTGGGSYGGWSNNCNHKVSRSPVYAWAIADGGSPAGANVASSDGSVSWANFNGGIATSVVAARTLSMYVNGGSIGGWIALPTNQVWFRLDGTGQLDNSRSPFNDNYIVGIRNLTFQSSF